MALHALNDYYASGTTVNVGVVRADTRPNVMAAAASARRNVQVETWRKPRALTQAIRGLAPHRRTQPWTLDGGLNRPPMERSPAMAALFGQAQQIAATMGVEL